MICIHIPWLVENGETASNHLKIPKNNTFSFCQVKTVQLFCLLWAKAKKNNICYYLGVRFRINKSFEPYAQCCTHLIYILEGVDDIIWQAWQQVNNKPSLKVIHSNQLGVWDDLTGRSNKCGVEV